MKIEHLMENASVGLRVSAGQSIRATAVEPSHPGSFDPFVSISIEDRIGNGIHDPRLDVTVRLDPVQARQFAQQLVVAAESCEDYGRQPASQLSLTHKQM